LKWAHENGAKCLRVVSDSELMVKQMKGQYAVKSPALRPLYEEARRLSRQLAGFRIEHTLRAGNKEADELANQAMDRGMGKNREQGTGYRDQATGQGSAPGLRAPAARPYGRLETSPRPSAPPAPPVRNEKKILEGYVKNGVVHLLGGELPDGVFVKIVCE
jgi:probable phosphoglycerate mutase